MCVILFFFDRKFPLVTRQYNWFFFFFFGLFVFFSFLQYSKRKWPWLISNVQHAQGNSHRYRHADGTYNPSKWQMTIDEDVKLSSSSPLFLFCRHTKLNELSTCKECFKRFKTKWSLATHVSRFHRWKWCAKNTNLTYSCIHINKCICQYINIYYVVYIAQCIYLYIFNSNQCRIYICIFEKKINDSYLILRRYLNFNEND